MPITGIDTIDGKQIIAAGSKSAISAYMAELTTGGGSLQGLYNLVSTNSAVWSSSDLPNDLVYTADIKDMATTAQLTEKLDTTAFSTVSGDFLTAVDLTPYQTTADMSGYVTTSAVSVTSGLLNEDIQTVSAAIPVLSSLNTEGITDIKLVNELPAVPVSTVLYLIPEV